MDAFLSYSSADRKLAERLREELAREGLSVWSDHVIVPGKNWRQRIEEAIRSSNYILVLLSPRDGADEAQQFTWQVALEAVWQDSDKRLIPILLPSAELPPFVRSGTSGQLRVVQVENPREVQDIAQAVLDWIKGRESQSPTATVQTRDISREVDDGRETALAMIKEYATSMIPPGRGDYGDDG
jgi:TIR domain